MRNQPQTIKPRGESSMSETELTVTESKSIRGPKYSLVERGDWWELFMTFHPNQGSIQIHKNNLQEVKDILGEAL